MISNRVKAVLEAGAAYPLDVGEHDPDALRLNANENRLGPPQSAIDAIRESAASSWRYPDAVNQPLRRAIADHLGLTPDMIRLGNGSDELLDVICTAFFDPGDRVVVPVPTFSVYELEARLNGLEPVFVDRSPPTFEAPGSELVAACSDAEGVFICRPNNPTGTVIAEDLLHAILETGVTVVLDEAYVEFGAESYVEWVRTYDNLIVTRTFSKFYGLAGVRIGYAVATADRIDTLGIVRSPYSVNRPAQAGALAAVRDEGYATQTRTTIRDQRARLATALRDRGIEVVDSMANFLLISPRPLGLSGSTLTTRLEEAGILIRDVSQFRGLNEDWARITVGTPSENGRLITVLDELVPTDR